MTETSKASNGDRTTAKEAVQPKHGMSVLRDKEARALVGLVCETLGEALGVANDMHAGIYAYQQVKASQEELCLMRDDALACLSMSEHYLLMLGSVLDDQATDSLSEERAPYPVYMTSPGAIDGR